METVKPEGPLPSSRWDILLYLLVGYVFYVALMTAFVADSTALSANGWLILQTVLKLVCLVGAAWLFGERRGRFTWAGLGLFPPLWKREWFGWVLVPGLLLGLFNILLDLAALSVGDQGFTGLAEISIPADTTIWGQLALVWFCTALVIPIAEEVFFRGAVYTWFEQRFGLWAVVIGSAAMFAVTRATFFDTTSPFDVLQSLVLGLVVAALMRRTRSLWVPIFVHVLALSLSFLLPVLLGKLL